MVMEMEDGRREWMKSVGSGAVRATKQAKVKPKCVLTLYER